MPQAFAKKPRPKSLLIVDGDKLLQQRLAKAMTLRGFKVLTAGSVDEALNKAKQHAPDFAVVDRRLADGDGTIVIEALKRHRPGCRAIIFTGYGSIANAVVAIRMGAVDYLAKPADADDILASLLAPEGYRAAPPETPMSADRVRWEHIQSVYQGCGTNVSETARLLRMHRRTLQRVLARPAPL